MVTLFQIPGGWGEPSVSPFCMKLECYLRMAGVPFESKLGDPRRAPRGKVPWLEDDGVVIPDSQLAIEHLKARYGDPLDAKLSKEQWARGHALRRMLEEGTYFLSVHQRWGDARGWAAYKPYFLPLLPAFIGGAVIEMIRRAQIKALHTQGVGRFTDEQKLDMMCADFEAVAVTLGRDDYLFGAEPSSFDATVYAFVTAQLAFPVPSKPKAFVEGNPALVAHKRRIDERYFGAVSRRSSTSPP